MTNAIILSAGQGRRLLPLTENRPKCLLPVGNKSILEWQLDVLLAAGIREVTVVTGFRTEMIEELINDRYSNKARVNVLFNPFFDVSDNLASCWIARSKMTDNFMLLNGDTIFEPAVLEKVLNSEPAPVVLTVDYKSAYDEDDMKVELDDNIVIRVGKTLAEHQTHAESIGLIYFREDGPTVFRTAIEEAMKHPAGLRSWFLSVIDILAGKIRVTACSISGLRWSEIDFVADLKFAESVFTGNTDEAECSTADPLQTTVNLQVSN